MGPHPEPTYLGYQDALREVGFLIDPSNEFLPDSIYSSRALEIACEALRHDFPFDGLFTTSMRITIIVLGALTEIGKHISTDIRLAAYGSMRIRGYGLMNILMLREPVPTMADAAVGTLLQLIKGVIPPEHIRRFAV